MEEFTTNITNVLPGTIPATKLYGTMSFKVARHAAKEEIYTNLNQEIDQFLHLAGYDWMTGDLGSKTSDYLVDVIAFLHSTFALFTYLPGKVTQTACMSACKHLATSLMQLLLEAEVRQLTLEALQQFNLDVRECGTVGQIRPSVWVPGGHAAAGLHRLETRSWRMIPNSPTRKLLSSLPDCSFPPSQTLANEHLGASKFKEAEDNGYRSRLCYPLPSQINFKYL